MLVLYHYVKLDSCILCWLVTSYNKPKFVSCTALLKFVFCLFTLINIVMVWKSKGLFLLPCNGSCDEVPQRI